MESRANGIGNGIRNNRFSHHSNTQKKVTNSKSNLLIFLFRNMKLRIIIIFLIVINILAIIILQIFQCYISSVFCMVNSVSQPFCIRYGIAQK